MRSTRLARIGLSLAVLCTACVSAPLPISTPSDQPSPGATTAPTPDAAAPSIWLRDPSEGGVLTDAGVTVTFSEPVRGVDAAAFQLSDAAGSVRPATVSLDPTARIATLVPTGELGFAATYTVTLSGLIKDSAGNRLARTSWTVATTDVVSFAAGPYTGYRFGSSTAHLTAVSRMTLASASTATASEYRSMNGAGYLLVDSGRLAGFWVHGTSGGIAQDDATAPLPPLPSCDYVDLPVARAGYDEWATTVLDPVFQLPTGYAPPDLVDTSKAGLTASFYVRRVALADLTAMVAAAKADGARLAVESAYRSYRGQQLTFAGWVRQVGYAAALQTSARPGHSEHQLGTAIDFKTVGGPSPWSYADWATTREGSWLAANAWKFGWLLSYPKGTSGVSCYRYEPWHYRYVGRTVAATVHAAGVTLRVWLWSQGYGVR